MKPLHPLQKGLKVHRRLHRTWLQGLAAGLIDEQAIKDAVEKAIQEQATKQYQEMISSYHTVTVNPSVENQKEIIKYAEAGVAYLAGQHQITEAQKSKVLLGLEVLSQRDQINASKQMILAAAGVKSGDDQQTQVTKLKTLQSDLERFQRI